MAIFDPIGLFGRLSWYAVWPVHQFVFAGMLKGIADAAGERADKNEIRRKNSVNAAGVCQCVSLPDGSATA